MTIIVSTHRPSLLNLVNRLLVFDHGKLVQDGPRDKVIEWLRGAQQLAGAQQPAKPAGVAIAPGMRAHG
jgi:ATP-binding cassette subfamily C protein LapB